MTRPGGGENLGGSGEARPAGPAEGGSIARPAKTPHVGLGERPRTDGAHLARQDIEELRDLVEPGCAKQRADARRPTVAHRPDLENGKRTPPIPEARLAKQHRAAI